MFTMIKKRIQKGSTSLMVLKTVALAGIGGVAFAAIVVAPGLSVLLPAITRGVEDWKRERRNAIEEAERRRVWAAIRRLRERRLIRFEERGKNTYIIITRKGKEQIRQFDYENMKLPEHQEGWDEKWRMVVFDIPEKFKKARHALHFKLRQLGFYPLQKSVFVYPYECRDEIDFVSHFCDVDRHVCYFIADSLDNKEVSVRKHFKLL